jgi:hypothetical protein
MHTIHVCDRRMTVVKVNPSRYVNDDNVTEIKNKADCKAAFAGADYGTIRISSNDYKYQYICFNTTKLNVKIIKLFGITIKKTVDLICATMIVQ